MLSTHILSLCHQGKSLVLQQAAKSALARVMKVSTGAIVQSLLVQGLFKATNWACYYLRWGSERRCAWGCELEGIMLPAGAGTCCGPECALAPSRPAGFPAEAGNCACEDAACWGLPAAARCCCSKACWRWACMCCLRYSLMGAALRAAFAFCRISWGICGGASCLGCPFCPPCPLGPMGAPSRRLSC